MRRREPPRPTVIPTWILGQQWQDFPGAESMQRQDAWEAAWRRWAAAHGLTEAQVREAISETASRLLYDPSRGPGQH